ncbi:MAG: hypothetical protein K0B15_15775 [Lentimicrobium sp.]|nr:hypothetical protein [Lentimicrobium sp.]
MPVRSRYWFLILQFLLFAIITTLAVIFFRERLIADSGYYLMRMINQGWPWVEHQRYILVLSQLLPWAGTLAGLPLTFILLLYSLNHVIFHSLVFYITAIRYQNLNAGAILILLQIAGISEGFFVPMFELYYAGSLLVLFAVVLNAPTTKKNTMLLLFSAFFILSSHPIGMVLLVMVLIFNYISTRKLRWNLYFMIFAMMAGFIMLKFFRASEYESGKVASIISSWINGAYNLRWLSANLKFMMTHYTALLIFIASISAIILLIRKFKIFTIYILFLAFVFVLSSLNTDQYVPSRYNEQVWFPLSVVAFLPLISSDFHGRLIRLRPLFITFFILFAAFRLGLIVKTGRGYAQRTSNLRELIATARQQEGQYFIADETQSEKAGIPGPNWSYPIESMLFSSESGPEKTITICTTEDYYFNRVNEQLDSTNYLFWRLGPEPLSYLNSSYFKLRHGKYQVLKPEK